jgi:hypothetical protein
LLRVVLITSGSVASVKMPDIVGALSQVTNASFNVHDRPVQAIYRLILM